MTDINKLGEEVAALIKSAEKDRAKIAPMLRTVWAELEAKKEVNGVRSKGAWAAKFGITLRYCQYIVKDGSRKAQKTRTTVRPVVTLKEGMIVSLNGVKYKVAEGEGAIFLEKNRKYMNAIRLAVTRVEDKKEEEPAKKSPAKKSSRVLTFHASDDGYRGVCGRLLRGYAGKPIQGNRIALPNERVDCPRCIEKMKGLSEPAKVKTKAAMVSTPEGTKFALDGKTHVLGMQWAGHSDPVLNGEVVENPTACGRNRKTNAIVQSNPTCKACQKAVEARQELSEPAKALAAAVDDATDPRRHLPTEAQREQRELLSACGNLDGDDHGEEEVL